MSKAIVNRIMVSQSEYLRGYNHACSKQAKEATPATGAAEFYEEGFNDGATGRRRGLEKELAQYVGAKPPRKPGEDDATYAARVAEGEGERNFNLQLLTYYRQHVAAAAGDVRVVMASVGVAAQRAINFLKGDPDPETGTEIKTSPLDGVSPATPAE